MSGSELILKTTGLTKRFGGLTAVDGFNFEMESGGIYGLIGPNGAGKTTVFNLVTGIIPPTSGTVVFNGADITNLPPHIIARRGIARTFQNIRLFSQLSVYNNVRTVAQTQANYTLFEGVFRFGRCPRQERKIAEYSRELIADIGLTAHTDMIAGNLPYGMQRRVEIARALALRPKLLVLDEPAAGMNEEESLALVDLIRELREKYNLSILVIDHHMDLIMKLCEQIMVINFGKFVAFGTPAQIQGNDAVIEAYLGVEEND